MMRLKRFLRPLIPDRVMARYRLQQHSRQVRANVDVFLQDLREARKWLRATPDTYRVRLSAPPGKPPMGLLLLTDDGFPVEQELANRAVAALADPEIGAAVVGEVGSPRLRNRQRAEPEVGPRLIATTSSVLDEVGGVPPGDHPLPGLLARIRDAGHRIGLIPVPRDGAAVARTDPVETDAIVILAAVPMHDIGGGSRSTQLALEFLRQGWHVTLVSLYEAQESVDLGLRFVHPNLEQSRVELFASPSLLGRVANTGIVLVEAPAARLTDKALALQKAGWKLIYDVIDDWADPALGGEWFRPQLEKDLIEDADVVIASAPDLVRKVEESGRTAQLVPNAVNVDVFGVDRPPRPVDLPEAGTIIGYHGSLYGDWFDWNALDQIAGAFPEAAIVLIGDDKGARPNMPANVHFLGLKPQTDLPAYLQRFDVGIIPFKVGQTTHAVSPLKAYEYLASGVPIAAPPLRALEGLAGVSTNRNLVAAIRAARENPRPDRKREIRQHSWATRLESLGLATQEPLGHVRDPTVRPAIHWDSQSRLLGS